MDKLYVYRFGWEEENNIIVAHNLRQAIVALLQDRYEHDKVVSWRIESPYGHWRSRALIVRTESSRCGDEWLDDELWLDRQSFVIGKVY